jgi:hypothetical protein
MLARDTVISQMECLFGSDQALGVWFQLEDGRKMSAADYDALVAVTDGDVPASSYLPHGGSAVCCTDYAAHIFLALPGRIRIVGFANEHNPSSRIARELIHPGGHDFAILDGRFIVDPWPRLVPAAFDQLVFDLADVADAALVLDIYGPQKCWSHNVLAETAAATVIPVS